MVDNEKVSISQQQKLSAAAVFLVLILSVSSCDFYYKNMPFASIPIQPISGSVEIGSDWVEIVPPQPLKPYGDTNWLNLEIIDYEKDNPTNDEEGKILNLADGRKSKVEAFLYDDKGEGYELQIGGTSTGITFYRKMAINVTDGNPKYKAVRFPVDRTYTKLKIRSEIPLRCNKIEWIGSKPM